MAQSVDRRVALVAVAMTSFATPFMLSGVNIGLPAIGKELGLTVVALGWVTTIYSLATGIFLLPFGKLADIYGHRRIFLLGIALYAIASGLCAVSHSGPTLLMSRAVQGGGAAMIFATGTAILTSLFPSQQRGRVLGFNVAAVYAGLSVGPLLGGILIESLGWRSVFWANVLLALVAWIFTAWKVRGEWTGSTEDRFDLVGSAVYGVSILTLMLGVSRLPSQEGIWLVVGGILAGAVFLWYEGRTAFPVLELRLFRASRIFGFSSLAALMHYAAAASVTFLMSLYLQYIKGLSPREAGLVLVAQPVVQAILSPVAGWVSDRIPVRWVASLGMAFTLAGLVLLTRVDQGTSMPYITLCLLVLGVGFALFSSPNTSAIMGAVSRQYYGLASALVATMRTLGQMLSMGIVMILFALYMGQVQITASVYPQFLQCVRIAFGISTLLCAIGLVASMMRGERRSP